MNRTRTLCSLLAALALTGCGGAPAQEAEPSQEPAPQTEEAAEARYVPGTYEATAGGYTDDITVAVTVDETQILSIEVVKHQETGPGGKALGRLIQPMIDANSAAVSAVTGATITSTGCKQAVYAALQQAKSQT